MKSTRFSLCTGLIVLTLAAALVNGRAATLAGDYRLQDVYTSSVPTAGPLVPVDTLTEQMFIDGNVNGNSQRVLQFTGVGSHHGVQLQTNPFISSTNYSLVLLASFDLSTTAGVVTKVFDFKKLSADAGLYINSVSGLLSFNGVTPTPPIGGTPAPTGSYTQIVLTRDGATGLVSVYQAGTLAFSFSDTAGLAIIGDATPTGNSFLTIFDDDNANVAGMSVESSNGRIARFRIFDGVLTAAEVMALDTTVVPEPSTYALLVTGVGALALAVRRRRVQASA